MPDFNPIVVRRMLFLRQCAMFAAADLDELATIAENVVGMTYPAGTIVAPANRRLTALRFIVDGRIETNDRRWEARDEFGAIEIAAARELSSNAVATLPTEAFELSAVDFADVLEDNFGVLVSVLRHLANQMLELGSTSLRRPRPLPAIRNLGLVERLLVLRQVLPFTRTRVQALVRLAHDSEEVHLPIGTVLHEDEPATGGFVIIEGAVRTNDPASPVLGPGDSLGYLETLAGRPPHRRWTTGTGVRALRTSGAAFLDVLEDHSDIGLALIAAFSTALLDRNARFALVPANDASNAGSSLERLDVTLAQGLLRTRS